MWPPASWPVRHGGGMAARAAKQGHVIVTGPRFRALASELHLDVPSSGISNKPSAHWPRLRQSTSDQGFRRGACSRRYSQTAVGIGRCYSGLGAMSACSDRMDLGSCEAWTKDRYG